MAEVWRLQNAGATLPPDLRPPALQQQQQPKSGKIGGLPPRPTKGVLTTLDERVQHSFEGDEASTQIRSECEAKCAARKIFRNVAKPKAKFIYLDDLMRFLPEEEAIKTFNLVEGSNETEKISKASLKSWVVNAFIERRALDSSGQTSSDGKCVSRFDHSDCLPCHS